MTIFKGPKNQTVLFVKLCRFTQFLARVFVKKIQIKFLPASMISRTNCDNLSSNPLQEISSDFPKAACDSQPVFLDCSESRQ
jgi:hypothetical protein